MVGAEIAFLLLVQAQATPPEDAAKVLDAAVRKIPGYTADEAPILEDEAFLRKLFQDLVNDAPSDAQLRAFAIDPDPKKRAAMIDRLVDDGRFAEFWSKRFSLSYFGDLERPGIMEIPDKPYGTELRAVKKFQGWLRDSLKKDEPWTEIVSQIVGARGTLEGNPALAYRLFLHRNGATPTESAQGVARDFLGIRLYCARCHDHPYDRWHTDNFYSLAAFFARQEAKGVGSDVAVRSLDKGEVNHPDGLAAEPRFFLGGKPEANEDRTQSLARLMTDRSNLQLPRALANRVWGWLVGAGIVNPVDDFNLKNRAASSQLLEALVRDTIASNYSVKRLVRVVCNTNAYQQAAPEEVPPGLSSFRQVVEMRGLGGRVVPAKAPLRNAPWPFEPPAGWSRARAVDGSTLVFIVRGKADPTLRAEIYIVAGVKDRQMVNANSAQFTIPLLLESPLEDGSPVVLREISGPCSCVASNTNGPTPWATSAAAVGTAAGPYTVKFEGHASVVREWRAEFIQLLKSAK